MAWRGSLTGWLLVLPALVLVFGLLAYPVVFDIWLSLTNAHDSAATGSFIGLGNYLRLFLSGSFWVTTRTTAFLTLGTAAVALAIGVLTALLLWRRFFGRSLLFLAVFVPWAFPAGFSAMAWYWLLTPPFHSFYTSQILVGKFWFQDVFGIGAWQVLSIAVMNVWRSSSIIAIFTLAGFNAIPEELLEFGRLEASGAWQYFWRIVAPLSRRFLVLAGLVALVISYTEYTAMYVETGGRILVPVLGTLSYTEGIMNGNTAMGAAVAIVQVGFAVLLTLAGLRLLERPRTKRLAEDYGWKVEGSVPLPSQRERLGEGTLGRREAPPRRRRHPHLASPARGRGILMLAALAVMVFHIFPVYYTAIQAIRPVDEIANGNIFWAYHPDFGDLTDVVTDPVLAQWGLNTLVVFGIVLVIGIAAALLAGYSLARLRLRGGRWLIRLMFFCYFIPQTAVILPLYQLYNFLHLDNTLAGLILVYFGFAVPFATWLFAIYFENLDTDVENHALLDGGRVAVFWRIVLPMAWPAIIAAGLFAIGMMGSDVLYAATFSLSNAAKTLPGGLGITAIDLDEWANVNAAILISSLPIVALCAGLGRYFVSGLRSALLEGA